MDLTTATPVEIDTAIAAIVGRYYAKVDEAAKRRKAADQLEREFLNPDWKYYRADNRDRYEDSLVAHREAHARLMSEAYAILAETAPYDAEFTRRNGWSRFFLVEDGHIHKANTPEGCRTLRSTTRPDWLPNLSGKDEAAAIAHFEAGTKGRSEVLCTVCYPNAPVAWTQKQADPSICPGSGTTDYPRETARLDFYGGNYGECQHCGERVTVPRGSVKMRKHKRAT